MEGSLARSLITTIRPQEPENSAQTLVCVLPPIGTLKGLPRCYQACNHTLSPGLGNVPKRQKIEARDFNQASTPGD